MATLQKMRENGLRGRRIAVLATDGFEYIELIVPLKALRAAGADVHVISLHDGKIRGMTLSAPTGKVKVDRTVEQVDARDYDALFIPGGFVNPDFLRQSRAARELVADFDVAQKPIATICHGPWLLVSAGLVRGRTLASWPSVRDDIVNAGGTWRDQAVVRDGNWVSSRGPQDLKEFVPAMYDLFSSKRVSARLPSTLTEPTSVALSSPQPDEPNGPAMAATRFMPSPAVLGALSGAGLLALGATLAMRARKRRSTPTIEPVIEPVVDTGWMASSSAGDPTLDLARVDLDVPSTL